MTFILLTIALVTFTMMLLIKLGLPAYYTMHSHKLPKFFPSDFCLICASFWLGLVTTIILGQVFDASIIKMLITILLTPSISAKLNG